MSSTEDHTYKFNVKMTCGGCSGAVERVLKKLEGMFRLFPFCRLSLSPVFFSTLWLLCFYPHFPRSAASVPLCPLCFPLFRFVRFVSFCCLCFALPVRLCFAPLRSTPLTEKQAFLPTRSRSKSRAQKCTRQRSITRLCCKRSRTRARLC